MSSYWAAVAGRVAGVAFQSDHLPGPHPIATRHRRLGQVDVHAPGIRCHRLPRRRWEAGTAGLAGRSGLRRRRAPRRSPSPGRTGARPPGPSPREPHGSGSPQKVAVSRPGGWEPRPRSGSPSHVGEEARHPRQAQRPAIPGQVLGFGRDRDLERRRDRPAQRRARRWAGLHRPHRCSDIGTGYIPDILEQGGVAIERHRWRRPGGIDGGTTTGDGVTLTRAVCSASSDAEGCPTSSQPVPITSDMPIADSRPLRMAWVRGGRVPRERTWRYWGCRFIGAFCHPVRVANRRSPRSSGPPRRAAASTGGSSRHEHGTRHRRRAMDRTAELMHARGRAT